MLLLECHSSRARRQTVETPKDLSNPTVCDIQLRLALKDTTLAHFVKSIIF